MDEYLVDVLLDNKQETLKTWATSIYSVIDSMITFESVQDIFKVVRNGKSLSIIRNLFLSRSKINIQSYVGK